MADNQHDAFNHEESMAYGRMLIAKTFGEDAVAKTNIDVVMEWFLEAAKRADRAERKVKAINTFLIDFGTFGQNDQAIWEYLNHGTPLPVKEEGDG